ncbi:hypothetical protein EV363DRAFT_1400949 [Boletus edulis]|nr:hypothetical protein EV363DRAFT_1411885 [Boletus edulis]KAF8127557.1 hypothetical protein EV363DRAFT_1400949 [Boletus edulis]
MTRNPLRTIGKMTRSFNFTGTQTFKQTPAVRLLYLQVAIAHIMGSSTVTTATNQLQDGLDIIELCGTLPTNPAPRRSLASVKKDLGLQVDDFIRRLPICDVCYKCYTTADIDTLGSPRCTVPRCQGSVYRTKRVHSKNSPIDTVEKRVPAKFLSYSPLIKALAQFLKRPTFVEHLRDTSQDLRRLPLTDDESMHDIHDGTEWTTLELGLKRVLHPDGRIEDIEEFPGSRRSLFSCDLGLSVTVNIDWFGITDGRPHSAGAVYVSFNNLHRSVRYLTQNVHLAAVIPGPKEPSLECLNHCIEPLKEELHALYKGNSDVPASRKLTGAAAHSHKTHPCNYCFVLLRDIDTPVAYDIKNFRMRNDWEQLSHADRSLRATTKVAKKNILDTHGVRPSILNDLPGWLPSRRSPIDFMHNFYALVKRFVYDVLTAGHLLDASGWVLYEATINSIIWPSGIGRLPRNLNDDHALPKADQWRRLSNILPFVLWICWRDQAGSIRSTPPTIPVTVKTRPTFQRDIQLVYKLSLYLAVSERILAGKSISPTDVDRGQAYLQLYCQGLQSLGVHQTINSHLAMHYSLVFRRYGPAYATWLFGFERFNGVLEDVNLNGHNGGEMEYSLMRDWVEKHRLHDLAVSLPADGSDKERKLIQRILDHKGLDRGTLQTQIAGFTAGSNVPLYLSSKKFHNLRDLSHPGVYGLLISFLQNHFPELSIRDDMSTDIGGTVLFANQSVRVLPFVIKNGIRFGCSTAMRTSSDHFAGVLFEDGRWPCKVVYHFELGVTVVYEKKLEGLEIISSSSLSCSLIVIPVPTTAGHRMEPLWIVTSCDRTGLEVDDGLLEDDQGMDINSS